MFIAVTAAFHLHFMLTVGDWDFWIDWKDRQSRVTATPVGLIMFPAALQYVFWERFRLPIGATLAMLALTFGVWVSRTMGFHLWSYFPFSFGDYIGYAFTRTSTPAYLRFIERGTLRTFGGHSAGVSAFFSGFICIFYRAEGAGSSFFSRSQLKIAKCPRRILSIIAGWTVSTAALRRGLFM